MKQGWEKKRLGEVCSMIARGIAPKYTESEGIQVINQKCIRDHYINMSLARTHNVDLKPVNSNKLIQVGDVLVNSTGVGTLGRVAQVRHIVDKDITVDTHVTIVRPTADIFFLDFFGYLLIKIEDEIEKSGEGASGQIELPRKKLENNFVVNYPNSFQEQKRIVAKLDKCFEATKKARVNVKKTLLNLDELDNSILQKAFNGEL